MELFYRSVGEGSQAIVLLHGLFGSGDNFNSFAKTYLSDYRVFIPDARNHGKSPHSEIFNYNAMANDVSTFISHHEIENPILIGHSMGGKTAMKYAVRTKNPIKKLVVIDIAPRYYAPHHQVYLEAMQSLDLKSIHSRNDADLILQKTVSDAMIRQFLLKNLDRNTEGTFEWKINLPIISEQIENIGEALDTNNLSPYPTLFIGGEKSDYIKSEDTGLIKKIFPYYKIETISGAGHWIHAEKPKELSESILKFISK